MKKYFYLKKKNEWSRPLTIFSLIFFVFIGKINRFTTIWHTGLCHRGVTHPDKCIHPSINAIDISFLPKWLFNWWHEIPALFIRKIKKVKTRITGKKKIWEEVLEMPKLLENAIKKNLIPSIRAIHSFCSGGEYLVNLKFTTLDNESEFITKTYRVRLKEAERNYIEFQIFLPEIPNVGGVMHKESYGLNNELYLENGINRLRVMANSVTNFSTKFPYVPQVLQGQFTQLNEVTKSNYKDVYLRLIVLTTDKDFKAPISILSRSGDIIFDKEDFNIHHSLMGVKFKTGSGYSEITVKEKRYHFYSVEYYSSQASLIVLECLDKNDLESFKLESGQIRLAFGFLSGSFYRGEAYYLSSSVDDFREIEGVWYEKELESIITSNQILNPIFFFQGFENKSEKYKEKYSKYHDMFSAALFSDLCNSMLTEDEIQRAILLIVNGSGSFDSIQKGALYSVALETLTNFFSEKHSENLKPIQDKNIENSIIADFKMVLLKYSHAISEEVISILEKKISHLNQPTNRDKLVKPFEIYGVELDESDKQAIGKRNDYLHGRIPLNKEDEFELNKLALKLHFLASCLILKYIGYEGHVINLPLWSIYENEEKLVETIATRAQEELKLLKYLQEALNSKNEQKFHEFKDNLREFYATHEVNNLIRFI